MFISLGVQFRRRHVIPMATRHVVQSSLKVQDGVSFFFQRESAQPVPFVLHSDTHCGRDVRLLTCLFTYLGLFTYTYLLFVVQFLSRVCPFVTRWAATHQSFLSFTISQSLLKLMSIESVMLSNHLILCHPLLLPPLIFLSIRVFAVSLLFASSSIGASASAQPFQ